MAGVRLGSTAAARATSLPQSLRAPPARTRTCADMTSSMFLAASGTASRSSVVTSAALATRARAARQAGTTPLRRRRQAPPSATSPGLLLKTSSPRTTRRGARCAQHAERSGDLAGMDPNRGTSHWQSVRTPSERAPRGDELGRQTPLHIACCRRDALARERRVACAPKRARHARRPPPQVRDDIRDGAALSISRRRSSNSLQGSFGIDSDDSDSDSIAFIDCPRRRRARNAFAARRWRPTVSHSRCSPNARARARFAASPTSALSTYGARRLESTTAANRRARVAPIRRDDGRFCFARGRVRRVQRAPTIRERRGRGRHHCRHCGRSASASARGHRMARGGREQLAHARPSASGADTLGREPPARQSSVSSASTSASSSCATRANERVRDGGLGRTSAASRPAGPPPARRRRVVLDVQPPGSVCRQTRKSSKMARSTSGPGVFADCTIARGGRRTCAAGRSRLRSRTRSVTDKARRGKSRAVLVRHRWGDRRRRVAGTFAPADDARPVLCRRRSRPPRSTAPGGARAGGAERARRPWRRASPSKLRVGRKMSSTRHASTHLVARSSAARSSSVSGLGAASPKPEPNSPSDPASRLEAEKLREAAQER